MHPATIELMHEQVRTIYRAATGAELRDDTEVEGAGAGEPSPPGSEEVERRFAELEALVRQDPELGARVPPFSFSPLLDVIDEGAELCVEVAVPGVELSDVTATVADDLLKVSGVRRGERIANGRSYAHAEIPRGPFERSVRLPYGVEPDLQLAVQNGLIVIRLYKRRATGSPHP
jgi:HSP20 family protein